MEELGGGGSGSPAGGGHSCGGVGVDRWRWTHRSRQPSERRRERVGVRQGARLWLSPLSSIGRPPANASYDNFHRLTLAVGS
jgi:hypothetical protein